MSYSSLNPESVSCSIQDSNCCFLTHRQVSRETGKMVWYSHLLKNLPQVVMIHTVKGFSVVSEAEVDVFLEFPCFLYDPTSVGSLISGSSAFSKPSLNIWKFLVHILLKPSLKDFEHNLISTRNERYCPEFEHSLALPFSGIIMKTDLSQSCGHCSVFQICCHIECRTLTALSF